MTSRKKAKQRTIARLGQHGRRVRVFEFGHRVTVQCRTEGITKSFTGKDAHTAAMEYGQRLSAGIVEPTALIHRPSVGELWAAYTRSSDFRALRPRSAKLYLEFWSLFVTVVPVATPADEVTGLMIDEVRAALEDTPRPRAPEGLGINTVRKTIGVVKVVWAWAERSEFLTRNRIYAFKFKVAKELRPTSPDEYAADDFARLLGTLSFDKITQRTPYCVLALCGYQGARINAVLHLRWEDVDWSGASLVWRSRWDKQGNEWHQPLRERTRAMLADLWVSVGRPASGWLFPARRKGAKSEVYTVQSFWSALKMAEARAGIPHKRGRAAHGFRRMVSGDVAAATGSALDAMNAIGDTDVRQAALYVKRRSHQMAKALNSLDAVDAA